MEANRIQLETDQQILRNQFAEFKKLITVFYKNEIKDAGIKVSQKLQKIYSNIFNQNILLKSFIDGEILPEEPKKEELAKPVTVPIPDPVSELPYIKTLESYELTQDV